MIQFFCAAPTTRGQFQLHFRTPRDVRVIDPQQCRVHAGPVESCLAWLQEHGLALLPIEATMLAGKLDDLKRIEEMTPCQRIVCAADNKCDGRTPPNGSPAPDGNTLCSGMFANSADAFSTTKRIGDL